MSLHPDERDPAIKLEDEESYQPTKTRPGALEVEYKPSQTGGVDTMLYPTLAEEEQSFLSQCQRDWLYPPNVPRECQLLRLENLAVPACYLVVGLLQGLSMPVMNAYPLDLQATEAQQVTVSTIRSLPASFKLIFGFISDNFPLGGYRRKSYMLLGWMLASVSIFALMLSSNLTLDKDEGPPLDAPSIPGLSVSLLCFGTGFWLADVMGDSLVAEKAKIEIQKGQLQSTCYACRFFGIMVAAPLATFLYSLQPQYVFGLLCLVPLFMLPLIVILKEPRNIQVRPTSEQCNEIWNTVCSRAVWQPMAFVYVYNVLQVTNSPWKEFLRTGLGFSSQMINSISVVAYVLLFFGIMAYKYYFISWSWRSVYIMTSLLNGVFSLGQILVINGKTFGLSPFLFAMGDDAFTEFNQGIQFLPTTIMMVHLCPAGSEGASYAMFTTVNNSANVVATAISTNLLRIWKVGKETLAAGDYRGLINLTYLTTAVQISGVLFVGWLPRTKEDLAKLGKGAHHPLGGAIFLAVLFLSICYSILVGVLNIVSPGWMGET